MVQNQAAANGNMMVPTASLAAKFNSKREIYNLLSYANAYLPNHNCVTIYHLSDLMSGKKKCK
jgi:hypothetical protein